jgi:probable F420-dependent oxidoreductase
MERIGVGFSGGMSPPDIVECVQLAEDLGYESAWVAEGHGGDQFAILTACAVATSRIKLGTSITSVFVRTAPTIAMAAATVDHFSNGRFILGLGSSHKVQVEPEHGLEFIRPIERMRECTEIVRGILRDGDIKYSGNVYNIERFDLWFEPVRQQMPIYYAAVRPRMLEICGEVSDGVILTWCTLDHAATAVHHISEGAKRAGRNPDDVDVTTLIACAVSEDRDAARDELRRYIASYVWRFPRYRRLVEEAGFAEEVQAVAKAWREGRIEDALNLAPAQAVAQAWRDGRIEDALNLAPAGLVDTVALAGSPEECRERLQKYREAGIKMPIISPRASGPNAKERAMAVIRACAPSP